MKKYKVIDLQKGNFMNFTEKEPMTAQELRSHFWNFDECRTPKFKNFTLDEIRETWQVEFEEVKKLKIKEEK